jgi:hypothetical protein
MKTRKSSSLTDAETLELAHHPTVITAEILAGAIAPIETALRDSLIFDPTEPDGKINLAGAIVELSKAIRAATIGDEILGIGPPIQEASKTIAAAIHELAEAILDTGGA